MQNSILSKENSLILRGVAIITIMLHNFIHYPIFGFSQENEMSYSQERADTFLNAIRLADSNLFCELISYIGWTGVPIFVFLTGYGLAKKHPPRQPIDGRKYLIRNYLKLFLLMLPAVLFFLIIDVQTGHYMNIMKRMFSILMLQNFAYPFLRTSPGVYWYFSLTFQYYIIWLLLRRWFTPKALLWISILSLAILFLLGQSGYKNAMSIYRHCFTGWFPIFAIGVFVASEDNVRIIKISELSQSICCVTIVLLFPIIILMNINYITWLLVPIVTLLMFVLVAKLLVHTKYLSALFRWIGLYSACIFVCHPIARKIVFMIDISCSRIMYICIIYIGLTLLIAFFYKKLYSKLKLKYIS